MRVVLPSIAHYVNKKKCTVYTIDVWPQNSKYAVSGGQDSTVRVWTIEEKGSREEQKYTKHAGAVLCVRFSICGKMLATASDDGTVLIWSVEEKGTGIELHTIKKLTEHKSDVSSVCWSEKHVVTCSYDGSVYAYSTDGYVLEKKLDKHEKGCKGVSYSPGCKYLVTYGDEGVLYMYNKGLVRIGETSRAFRGAQRESFFARMSWSPNGKYVACGLAFVERRDAVAVFTTGLEQEYALVGHAAPVETVAFNPKVWEKDGAKRYIVATGGQDRAVAIWCSDKMQPYVLLREVAEQPIMDMRWSTDGLCLVGCAYDGQIFAIVLDEKEMGTPSVAEVETEEHIAYTEQFIQQEIRHTPMHKLVEVVDKEEDKDGVHKDKTDSGSAVHSSTTESVQHKEKKKIVPRVIAPLAMHDRCTVKGERVVLFVPETVQTTEIEEEKCAVQLDSTENGIAYRTMIDRSTNTIEVSRNGAQWFSSTGLRVKMAAVHRCILAVVNRAEGKKTQNREGIESVWIYNIEECIQVCGAMMHVQVVSVDVLDSRILVVLPGRFRVVDTKTNTCTEDIVILHREVLNIALHTVYYLVVLYGDGTTQYYDTALRCWMVYKTGSGSVYSDTYTEDDIDSTLEHLENRYIQCTQKGEWDAAHDTLRKILQGACNVQECSTGLTNRIDGIVDAYIAATGSEGVQRVRSMLQDVQGTHAMQKYAQYKIEEIDRRDRRDR